MFISPRRTRTTYTRNGEQRTSGPYAFFAYADTDRNTRKQLYVVVRNVHMQQCGNFMMGTFKFDDHNMTISGACASDGLPDRVSTEVIADMHELPQHMVDAFWRSDTESVRTYILANEKAFRTHKRTLAERRAAYTH